MQAQKDRKYMQSRPLGYIFTHTSGSNNKKKNVFRIIVKVDIRIYLTVHFMPKCVPIKSPALRIPLNKISLLRHV